MTKKQINKISDKLKKVSDSFTVTRYDNGFLFEAYGQDANDNGKYAKIIVSNVENLHSFIDEFTSMENDE